MTGRDVGSSCGSSKVTLKSFWFCLVASVYPFLLKDAWKGWGKGRKSPSLRDLLISIYGLKEYCVFIRTGLQNILEL